MDFVRVAQRIVGRTVHDWPSAADVALRARRLAGVPVRDALDIGALRYRMTLVCADQEACRAAMARIAADRSFALGDVIREALAGEEPRRAGVRICAGLAWTGSRQDGDRQVALTHRRAPQASAA